jgi:hypothetical protein
VLLHGLRRRGDRLVLLLALVQLQSRRRLDGSALAAADAHAQHAPVAATDTIAVVESDAGARRSYGSTGVRANA